MAEKIALEVPASVESLSVVRMVLGGVGARLDFSLEQLDDLYLATTRLFEAAFGAEQLDHLSVALEVDDGGLRVAVGSFTSPSLREQVAVTPGNCLDLCTLLQGLLDDVRVEEEESRYRVVLVKRVSGAAA